MTQTTDSIWGGAAKVEFSSDGSDWTDISGHGNSVLPSPVERRQGEAYTFSGEYPIVKVGKRNSISIDVRIVYTEESADAFELARAQFEAAGGGTAYLRWSPAGGSGGDKQYTTDAGFVRVFPYPPVDAEEDGPMMVAFTIQCAQIISSTVAT